MNRITLKQLLSEIEYDSISKVVSNPEQNERTLDDILKDFKENGGKILGQGRSGIVLEHPKWKFIIKIFSQDAPYLSFVRFCLKNPRKSFPVFFDKPRRIIPNFKRHRNKEYLYIVKTEKLEPINKEEYSEIQHYIYYGDSDFESRRDSPVWNNIENKVKEIEKKYPSIKDFFVDYNFLMKSGIKGTPDIAQHNIMKRPNGQFILTDPFWEGETPYQTAARLAAAETDHADDEDENPNKDMIKGGKKWKSPKPIKLAKVAKSIDQGDSPF